MIQRYHNGFEVQWYDPDTKEEYSCVYYDLEYAEYIKECLTHEGMFASLVVPSVEYKFGQE